MKPITKPTHSSIIRLAKLARRNSLEFFQNGWDFCIRPQLFNDEGIREIRYYPDPCEFEPMHEALKTMRHWLDRKRRISEESI